MKNKASMRSIVIIALVAVIGFSMAACGGGGGGDITAKTIVITGITGAPSDRVRIRVFPAKIDHSTVNIAEGRGVLSYDSGSVTVVLTDRATGERWNGSGQFKLELTFGTSLIYWYTDGRLYNYTNGYFSDDMPKYNLSSTISTIPFNKFSR